ncbi:hypothetical protein [Parapedobacter sp. DT-150]|uniref:hypothetical protein n=1 Tax=Parapedobacter sp. DT-150 TaxID=3396162 RepID=UPI003F1B2517
MSIIATYLLFISALSGYRGSKYWPSDRYCPAWLRRFWWGWGAAAAGIVLMVLAMGWTTGLLVAFCAYTTALSGILFAAACGRRAWQVSLVALHLVGAVLLLIVF